MDSNQQQTSQSYSKRPIWQWILLYLVIAAIAYAFIYYFIFAKKAQPPYGQTNTQSTSQSTTQQPIQSSVNSTTQTTKIIVTGNEFAFTPATITVKVGQQVQITFTNEGKYPHNFTLNELNLQTKTIQPGQQDKITFTPTKTGSFIYTCTVPGHADRGMKGTLIVQ